MSVVMEVYVRGYEKAIRIESKEMFVVYLRGASGYTHYDYKGVGTCLGRSKGISVVIGNMQIVGVLKNVSAGRFKYYGGQFVKWKRYVIFGFGNVGAPLSWGAFSLFVHWCSEIIGKVQRHHQSRKWEC